MLELWGRLVRTVLLEVSPEGKIFLAGSGPLVVAGHTLAWAQEHVASSVQLNFRDVRSDLRLVRLRTFKVYVAGLVSRGGAIEATPVARSSEALAVAGLAKDASRRNIEIRRRDGSRRRVDLQLFESTGRQDLDPLLEDGDVLTVPRATEFVEAHGAATNPGRYELAPEDKLSTLFQMMGGILPAAAHDRVLLLRFVSAAARESLWLDLGRVEAGVTDPSLRDGDHLFVAFVSGYHELPAVQIFGDVMRPGSYPLTLGQSRLSDLIRWSGGFLPVADRSSIYLLRFVATGQDADPEFDRLARLSRQDMTESEYAVFRTKLAERKNTFRVDYDHLQRQRETDVLLESGDVVRVDPLVLSVRVEGEVARPGFVDYAPGRSLTQYVTLAGGFTDRASRGTVRVSRSVTGQVIPARSLRQIQPGDFIWVPERREVQPWLVLRDVITVAGQVAVVWLAVRR